MCRSALVESARRRRQRPPNFPPGWPAKNPAFEMTTVQMAGVGMPNNRSINRAIPVCGSVSRMTHGVERPQVPQPIPSATLRTAQPVTLKLAAGHPHKPSRVRQLPPLTPSTPCCCTLHTWQPCSLSPMQLSDKLGGGATDAAASSSSGGSPTSPGDRSSGGGSR